MSRSPDHSLWDLIKYFFTYEEWSGLYTKYLSSSRSLRVNGFSLSESDDWAIIPGWQRCRVPPRPICVMTAGVKPWKGYTRFKSLRQAARCVMSGLRKKGESVEPLTACSSFFENILWSFLRHFTTLSALFSYSLFGHVVTPHGISTQRFPSKGKTWSGIDVSILQT